MEKKKICSILQSEFREEKELLLPGPQYGNDMLMQRFVAREHMPLSGHLYDLPEHHVKIFSALYKTKKAGEKILQHTVL